MAAGQTDQQCRLDLAGAGHVDVGHANPVLGLKANPSHRFRGARNQNGRERDCLKDLAEFVGPSNGVGVDDDGAGGNFPGELLGVLYDLAR
jgi:hypothetical protein